MQENILSNFRTPLHVGIIGASGGIGGAFVDAVSAQDGVEKVYAFSRQGDVAHTSDKVHPVSIDIESEDSIAHAAAGIQQKLDILIVATGLLHNSDGVRPEKSLKDLDAAMLAKVFSVNATGIALVGKHFLPLLQADRKSVFAVLSARVGSIEDNKLGGWYAYRASKAALNMILKNFSIEMGLKNKNLSIIGMQPGTVETPLSKPFRGNVSAEALKAPDEAARALLGVINDVLPADSGAFLDWSGEKIPY